MALMKVTHPDVLEFISAKRHEQVLQNFNISVALTDEFMARCVEDDESPWLCEWDSEKRKPRLIQRDETRKIVDISEMTVTPSEIFDFIVEEAWTNGEPGCVFIDTVNRANPLPGCGPIECCNPCGEQYLHSGDACNLGAINLEKFVTEGEVDFEHLAEVTRIAVRLLDNVIDHTDFSVPCVDETVRANRRVGLGIMGLADMLVLTKTAYDSPEGRGLAGRCMKVIQETAVSESVKLGTEKGSFPNFDKSVWVGKVPAMRNASLTTVAPCGTTSLVFDVSSGIEPFYALAYRRESCRAGEMEPFVNKHLKKVLVERGCFTPEIMGKILESGSVRSVTEIPEDVKRVFVAALDMETEGHILMQSELQKFTDNAISKTINFPHSATRQMVRECFIEAWKKGCKGLTVYRDGSRSSQILEANVCPTCKVCE